MKWSGVAALLLLGAACDVVHFSPAADAGRDNRVGDLGADSRRDASDRGVDLARDFQRDERVDEGRDLAVDEGRDLPVDERDPPRDEGLDLPTDLGRDEGVDLPVDLGRDEGPDLSHCVEVDETCDGVDDDCDGSFDEDFLVEPCLTGVSCTGMAICDGGATTCEISVTDVDECDDIDNDCDGDVEEAGARIVFVDGDRDGYGTGAAINACVGAGFAEQDGDCDDERADIHPYAWDPCGTGFDESCGTVSRCGCRTTAPNESGRTYIFCNDPRWWTTARGRCSSRFGATLAQLEDAEEIARVVAEIDILPSRWWVGAIDRDDEGDWEWDGGGALPLEHPFWAPGEPNNIGGEDCGEFAVNGEGSPAGNDLECNTQIPYICEMPTP